MKTLKSTVVRGIHQSKSHEPLGPSDRRRRIRKHSREFPNISLGTVYRNLNLLVELGRGQKPPLETERTTLTQTPACITTLCAEAAEPSSTFPWSRFPTSTRKRRPIPQARWKTTPCSFFRPLRGLLKEGKSLKYYSEHHWSDCRQVGAGSPPTPIKLYFTCKGETSYEEMGLYCMWLCLRGRRCTGILPGIGTGIQIQRAGWRMTWAAEHVVGVTGRQRRYFSRLKSKLRGRVL